MCHLHVCNRSMRRGVNSVMQICWSVPFFAKSVKPPIFFFKSGTTITSRKVNVNAIVTSNFAQIVKKATCLMTIIHTIPITVSHLSLIYRPRLKKDLSSEHQETRKRRHNPESAQKFTADPRFTVFSKSINPLTLQQKSTICILFKAKSINLKTYSPPPWGFHD